MGTIAEGQTVEIDSMTSLVDSAEDMMPEIGKIACGLASKMDILQATERPHDFVNGLTGVIADSNNGSSDGGSCGHCSAGQMNVF